MDSFESNEVHLNDLSIKYDPWGESDQKVSGDRSSHDCNMFFEDSFDSNRLDLEQEGGEVYIPLDDSEQYLEGLQKKLARIQGKTKSTREKEIKKMISDIAMSREDHTSNFMNSDTHEGYLIEEQCNEDVKTSSLNTVDPQGTLGVMMRKLAPEHVALTEEELYELLKRDALAKAYSQLHEEESEDSEANGCNNKTDQESNEEKDISGENKRVESST